ncbi:MAG TPA: FAD-dependent oxidoreductase [Cellvibrio sp.]|nr:FAD-dependent oxidoreductase [Cellvibrio sp.]
MSEQDLPLRLKLDTVIIGGGIAGLWLANRLKRAGFSLALFEHKALGSDQTIASQGMIHGGMKYTLSGALTGASETIADMPQHWRSCLCGEGDVNLRNTRILSDHFFLWSGESLTAKLASFLASKAIRGRVDSVPDEKRPPLFRHAGFNGNLYKLSDIVLDVHSLVTNLAQNIEGHTFLIDWAQTQLRKDNEGNVMLAFIQQGREVILEAQRFIFTAGKGNAEMLANLQLNSPAMQLRPLQQVMVKHRNPYVFFGHCMGVETTPRLTISTHLLSEHERVWYLGGSLAEKGAGMEPEQLIAEAQQELKQLLPWVDISEAEWATLPIARAEALQPQFKRPDNAFISAADENCRNLLVAWPTKLTLAPNLANQALELMQASKLVPGNTEQGAAALAQLQQWLSAPEIAPTPWEEAFPPAINAEERLTQKFAAEQRAAEERGGQY